MEVVSRIPQPQQEIDFAVNDAAARVLLWDGGRANYLCP
jgi:hypothetical protein